MIEICYLTRTREKHRTLSRRFTLLTIILMSFFKQYDIDKKVSCLTLLVCTFFGVSKITFEGKLADFVMNEIFAISIFTRRAVEYRHYYCGSYERIQVVLLKSNLYFR